MKKYMLYLFMGAWFLGCTGGFEPYPLLINLQFPNDAEVCQAGELTTNNTILIPFEWSVQGNFDDFRVEYSDGANTSEANISSGGLIELQLGTRYEWTVVATTSGTEIRSASRSFYSRGEPRNNFAPYPAVINIPSNSNGNVTLSWQVQDEDIGDTFTYELFLDDQNPPVTKQSIGNPQSTDFSTQLTIGQKYFALVRTTDSFGNYSEGILPFTVN